MANDYAENSSGLTPRKMMAQGKDMPDSDFDVKSMASMDTHDKPGPSAKALDGGERAAKPYDGLNAMRHVDTGSFK